MSACKHTVVTHLMLHSHQLLSLVKEKRLPCAHVNIIKKSVYLRHCPDCSDCREFGIAWICPRFNVARIQLQFSYLCTPTMFMSTHDSRPHWPKFYMSESESNFGYFPRKILIVIRQSLACWVWFTCQPMPILSGFHANSLHLDEISTFALSKWGESVAVPVQSASVARMWVYNECKVKYYNNPGLGPHPNEYIYWYKYIYL